MQYTEHTPADLDAMPTGTALADRCGSVWRKMGNGNWSIRSSGAGVTSGLLTLGQRVWYATPLAPGMILTDRDGDDWEVLEDGRVILPGDPPTSVKRAQRHWGPLTVRIAAEPAPEPADGTMGPMTEAQARAFTGALSQAVDDMLAKVRQAAERHTYPLTFTAGTGDDPQALDAAALEAIPTGEWVENDRGTRWQAMANGWRMYSAGGSILTTETVLAAGPVFRSDAPAIPDPATSSEQSKVTAWDRLADHPAFQGCGADALARSVPLVQAMADRLDGLLATRSTARTKTYEAAQAIRAVAVSLAPVDGAES